MSVYEIFIGELLKNNLIVDYCSKKKVVETYFNANYKQKVKCSFYLFCSELWHKWYVVEIKKNAIYFDVQWLDYINKNKTAQVPLKKKMSSEETFDGSRSCQLCLLKFSSQNSYQDHCNGMNHKVRESYKNNTGNFQHSGFLKFELNTSNNNVETSLKFQIKENTDAVIKVINTAESNVEIIDVVQVNLYQNQIKITKKIGNETALLRNGGEFNILITGYFENSASFTLPVVVVCRFDKEKEVKYFLKEVKVEVSSTYTSLKTGIPYHRPNNNGVLHERNDKIILGEIPKGPRSSYEELFKLELYRIPFGLQLRLNALIKRYPIFVQKFTPDKADKLYNEFASILKVNPNLIEGNYFDLLDTLISIEENQIQVDVRDYDTMSKLTLIGGNLFSLQVPGLAEARPSLMVRDEVYVKIEESDTKKYQGIVHTVLEKSVHLSFGRKFKDLYNKEKTYHIEFGYSRRVLKVQKQALFLARKHDILSYFYPKEGDIKQTVEKIKYFNPDLNKEQQRAVINILKDRSAPYLIFGPPGTGKTVTVVESILQIWKNKPQARILVCAPSNSATNEIAIRLLEEMPTSDMFRLVGYMYRKDSTSAGIKNIANINDDGSVYVPTKKNLLKHRVLLTTLVTAARLVNGGPPDGHYSYVFIDEGGYATEPESLIPIAGILSNSTNRGKVAGQIVLAGDPRQLGPVVHSNFVKFCGYGTSMLERLIDTCEIYARDETRAVPYNEKYVTKLLRNYRSHKEILNIPNKLFYHNELIPVGGASSSTFTKWEHLVTPGFPVIFHHIVGEDGREGNSPSFFNIQEIEEVMGYVQKLIGSRVKNYKIKQEDVGIVTPYKKQAQMLRKACDKQGWGDLLIGSVEQFQGKEKLVIIISTVRSKNVNKFQEIDKKCQLGFVSNAKRFNVALTRAKALLIVIGNGDVLKTDKNWYHFIEHCANNASVRGKPFHLDDQEYFREE